MKKAAKEYVFTGGVRPLESVDPVKLTRFNCHIVFGLMLLLLSGCSCSNGGKGKRSSEKKLPNIVFIFADDMGYGDPRCYNAASKIPTPNIDLIAANGIKLTNAHAPGAWCVPSRYGLMTGCYPARTKLNWQERALIDPQRLTVASMLQKQGYYTAMFGKWHLGFDGVKDWQNIQPGQTFHGGPVDRGFNEFFGLYASLDIPPYFYIENDHYQLPPTEWIAAHQSEDATTAISGAFWREGKIAPGFKHEDVLPTLTKRALGFLKEHDQKRKGQPFFLYFALTAPHTPWLPERQFQGKSQAGSYGDFVAQVDHTVGEVKEALEKLDLTDNTLFIFTSDNGPVWFAEDINKFNHRATDSLRGMKVDLWEGGHRIPFVAQWPGEIPTGTVRSDLFCFTDIMATFSAIIGKALPEGAGENSFNQLPVLFNQNLKEPVRRELLIDDRTFIQDNWKYIRGSGEGSLTERFSPHAPLIKKEVPGELYNLKTDISEQHNLYRQMPDKVKAMEQKLKQAIGSGGSFHPSVEHQK